jgi:hypothetical protein
MFIKICNTSSSGYPFFNINKDDLFVHCGAPLDVVVFLLSCFLPYPHHPHLPLDHCSPLGLDHGAHLHLHVHLDQALVRVEWYHLGIDLAVVHLDLVALNHQ